jgi:hypothetical protein
MERREKTEFILEQMRLLIAVARQKDAEKGKDGKETKGGGEAEWVKVRVGGRKVNEEFLKDKDNEVCSPTTDFESALTRLFLASQTEILRPHDSTCSASKFIPGCCKVLLQSMGDTVRQRRRS